MRGCVRAPVLKMPRALNGVRWFFSSTKYNHQNKDYKTTQANKQTNKQTKYFFPYLRIPWHSVPVQSNVYRIMLSMTPAEVPNYHTVLVSQILRRMTRHSLSLLLVLLVVVSAKGGHHGKLEDTVYNRGSATTPEQSCPA